MLMQILDVSRVGFLPPGDPIPESIWYIRILNVFIVHALGHATSSETRQVEPILASINTKFRTLSIVNVFIVKALGLVAGSETGQVQPFTALIWYVTNP
jgi:hypothetical protein